MNPDQAQFFESYVPVYDVVPENWEDARGFITEQLKKLANAVNVREIGWFLDEELLSGKQFIPSNATALLQGTAPQFRTILRKVIDFGVLPNTGLKAVPHGINFDNNFTLIQLFGSATDPSTSAIPLPWVEVVSPVGDIQLYLDPINVVIVTSSDRTNYTRCFVTIEYIQEV